MKLDLIWTLLGFTVAVALYVWARWQWARTAGEVPEPAIDNGGEAAAPSAVEGVLDFGFLLVALVVIGDLVRSLILGRGVFSSSWIGIELGVIGALCLLRTLGLATGRIAPSGGRLGSVESSACFGVGFALMALPVVGAPVGVAIAGVGCLAAGLLLASKGRRLLLAKAREDELQRLSHKLRTPAAAASALAQALERGDVEPAERERYLALLRGETDRLAKGLDLMLRASRGEAGFEAHTVPLDLVDWANGVRERWRTRLPRLEVEATGICRVVADPELLDEAVDALLDNAQRYGGPNVTLGFEERDGEVEMRVSDDGPGVPEAERAEVLRKDARGGGREPGRGGFGLGLWAVGAIARAHGGRLELRGGSTFVVRLPRVGGAGAAGSGTSSRALGASGASAAPTGRG